MDYVVGNNSQGRGDLATTAVHLWVCHIAARLRCSAEKLLLLKRLRRRGAECAFLLERPIVLGKPP